MASIFAQALELIYLYRLQLLCTFIFLILFFNLLSTWSKLRHIPGPIIAKFTNLPRLYWVWKRNAHDKHISLHEKYGKLVRLGSNMVSVGDPAEIEKIYRMHQPLEKSDFYHVILPMSKGKVLPGLFATQDENLHKQLKKPIASTYSMTNLVSFESFVDSTIKVFFQELDERFVKEAKVCDWGIWLQYFAFDVIGEITFSRRLGFLEQGIDVDNIISDIWKWFEYVAVVGQIPWLDYVWVKNPLISRLRPAKWSPMVSFAMKRQEERLQASPEEKNFNSRDFLSRFVEAMDRDPSIPKWMLPAWTSSNILAGSDTTAIYLRAIFANLLKHPDTFSRLRGELEQAVSENRISSPVAWKESRQLPYLDACIKEAGRIHPPFGLPLERVVSKGGLTICEEFIEEGTIVAMSCWVVHRDKDIFGEDADQWRPERWLEATEDDKKKMERSLLTFGAGHRSCLGKHISLLEIYKLVPTILLEYEIELIHAENGWRVENRWFVPQFGFNVKLKKARRL